MTNSREPAWPSTFSIFHFSLVISRSGACLEARELRNWLFLLLLLEIDEDPVDQVVVAGEV